MPLVVSQEGAFRMLSWILGTAADVVPSVHLLGNPYVPEASSTLTMFAANEVARGSGYQPRQLTQGAAGWTYSGLPFGAQAFTLNLNWSITVAETIYGYYVSDDTFGVSLWGELIPPPQVLGSGGGVYTLKLNLQLSPCVGQGSVPTSVPMPAIVSGLILPFAGNVVPMGFLPCDGSAVSRATYANLFAAIGTLWGAGDGHSTFNLPDLRDRTPIGSSPGGLPGNRPTARVVAATGGEETHTLLTAELAAHNHPLTDPGHNHPTNEGGSYGFISGNAGSSATAGTDVFGGGYVDVTTANAPTGVSVGNAGGGGSHNNMQPFGVVNWIIAT